MSPRRQLKAALKGASDDRIDAAVAAGKITKAQGDAMKARTAQDGVPFFGGPPVAALAITAVASVITVERPSQRRRSTSA